MKRILYILLSVAAVGCVKVDIHDTDHPTQGKLTLITDWSNRTTGVEVPASFTAESGGAKVTLTGTTTQWPNLFDPGTYSLTLYNTANDIAISGSTATVATQGTGIAAQPGHQFFGSLTTTIERSNSHSETVVMKQLTRDLAFDMTITEGDPTRITSITASLSGIAPSWDCAANTPMGTATSVTPIFTLSGNKLTASVRLLGVQGTKQELTFNFTFTDNKTKIVVSDISTQLTTFNTTTEGTISDWTVVEGGGINVTEPPILYAVGDLFPYAKAPIGVVFWVDPNDATYNSNNKTSAKGKIVGLTEATDKKWGAHGVLEESTDIDSTTDGASATKNLILARRNDANFATNYSAFAWVYTTVNGGDIDGRWYIPTQEELVALYGKDGATMAIVNASLATAKAVRLSSQDYWSSTQYNDNSAGLVYFNNGAEINTKKSLDKSVRVISAF